MTEKYTVIDLFSGAGGLTEGFLDSGSFEFLAHVEWELPMVKTLRSNLINRWGYTEEMSNQAVIHFDLQLTDELIGGNWSNESKKKYLKSNNHEIAESGLKKVIGDRLVDIVIGGPPCQAYSIAGRAQDSNSMKNDYRNYLFESFVKIVKKFNPKIFVFENVPGILSATPGNKPVLNRIYEAFQEIGYDIREPKKMKKETYLASEFGVPQNRNRVIIYGVRKNESIYLEELYSNLDNLKSPNEKPTVREAISHLPKFKPLAKNIRFNNKNISHEMINESHIINHIPRYHNERDKKIFYEWIDKNMNAKKSEEKLKFYFDQTQKKSNHVKYRSLNWDTPSPTIVAHLYKDGLMFIHPDKYQKRTITVKEAALLQSFPDNYIFLGTNSDKFKMIGNAVPVELSKKIAQTIAVTLRGTDD